MAQKYNDDNEPIFSKKRPAYKPVKDLVDEADEGDDSYDSLSGTGFSSQMKLSKQASKKYSRSEIDKMWAEKERKFNLALEMEQAIAKQRQITETERIKETLSRQAAGLTKGEDEVVATGKMIHLGKESTPIIAKEIIDEVQIQKSKLTTISILQSLFLFVSLLSIIFFSFSCAIFLTNEPHSISGSIVYPLMIFFAFVLIFVHVPYFVKSKHLVLREVYLGIFYIFILLFLAILLAQLLLPNSVVNEETNNSYKSSLIICALLEVVCFVLLTILLVFIGSYKRLAKQIENEVELVKNAMPRISDLEKTADLKVAASKPKSNKPTKPTKQQLTGINNITFDGKGK